MMPREYVNKDEWNKLKHVAKELRESIEPLKEMLKNKGLDEETIKLANKVEGCSNYLDIIIAHAIARNYEIMKDYDMRHYPEWFKKHEES